MITVRVLVTLCTCGLVLAAGTTQRINYLCYEQQTPPTCVIGQKDLELLFKRNAELAREVEEGLRRNQSNQRNNMNHT